MASLDVHGYCIYVILSVAAKENEEHDIATPRVWVPTPFLLGLPYVRD
jgi:hypothetical protein